MKNEFIILAVFIILIIILGIKYAPVSTFNKKENIGNIRRNINYAPLISRKLISKSPNYLTTPIYPGKKKGLVESSDTQNRVKFFPVVEKRFVDVDVPTGDINKTKNILEQKNEKLT